MHVVPEPPPVEQNGRVRQWVKGQWVIAAVVLGLGALALASFAIVRSARSFDQTIALPGPLPDVAAHRLSVFGRCDAAVTTAWHGRSRDELRLWAVTVGTNMMGYTPASGHRHVEATAGRFPVGYCVGEARHRLIVSGWMLAGAVGSGALAVALAVRRKPSVSAAP